QVANYEHALSIACHRNEKIEFSDFTLPKPNETSTPWTFVIMQVWREGTIQEVTVEEELIHKCGREMENSDKQKWYEADGKGGAKVVKGQDLQNSLVNHGEVTHGYRMHREDLVKFGGHNWDDTIGKVVKVNINHKLKTGARFMHEKADEQRINGTKANASSGALVEDEERPGNALRIQK
ncbi:unnamed protein product, partial [Darwinula stevensoni]